jgi:hydroxybutyrate-dimer hydrolase
MTSSVPRPLRGARRPLALAAAAAAAALLAACGGGSSGSGYEYNLKPAYVGTVTKASYDGNSNDLLTAGLGKSGLASATPPAVDAANPSAAELRRLAIYTNYRALLDMTEAGGYGRFYGPNVDANGNITSSEGKIAGVEYLAYSDDGSGNDNVALLVQIPATFNGQAPCIVTATSSGSRGVYGAIATGEWGLKRGCAVAYTDKGTGGAPHDLDNDTVPLIDGRRASATSAGKNAAFRANLSAAELAAYKAANPGRYAFKHAHSQRNPEKDWGKFTLQAVEFALWALNDHLAPATEGGDKVRLFKADNTLVIASSASNGGGAALAAAEQDTAGLIDAVVVAEPQVQLPASLSFSIRRGNTTVAQIGKTLYDYTTLANVYQPCAVLAPSLAAAPGLPFVVAAFAANRCASLKAKGLLDGSTTAEQAADALARLRAGGWEADSDLLHASHAAFEVGPAISVTYANAYSRASVKDNLCGYSYAAVAANGTLTTLAPASLNAMWATGNGVPPSSGVQLVNNLSPGLPLRDLLSFSPSTLTQDFNADGALCLRNLLTGNSAEAQRLRTGIDEVRRSGNLRGKPAIIVHGRADALVPVNHSSRPYFGLNKQVEGGASKLSYIEITNAQHFDSFVGSPAVLPGLDTRFVPIHVYLTRGLDMMWEHLRNNAALPPSQVVRTTPRGGTPGAAPALAAANVPPISRTPAAADQIGFANNVVSVPE